MRKAFFHTNVVLIFCLLAIATILSADMVRAREPGGEQPISISADQMEADDKEKVVTFSGNVVARQQDVTVTCNTLLVFYQPIPSPQSKPAGESGASGEATPGDGGDAPATGFSDTDNEIIRIECNGNVKITQGDRVALGEKAVYLAKAVPRTIILTGEPRIWRNRDFLTGKKITYFLDENRSIVEGGGKQRVNALFYSGEGKPAKEEQQGGTN